MVLSDFLSYLKKERGFSAHTVQAYENDLNRFILYIRFKDKYGDEDKWEDPFSFKVTRNGPRHLSFGYGQHLCIGWRLAEIQLTVCIEELLKRFPDFEVKGEVKWMQSNFLNSIKHMDVHYSG